MQSAPVFDFFREAEPRLCDVKQHNFLGPGCRLRDLDARSAVLQIFLMLFHQEDICARTSSLKPTNEYVA